MSDKKIMGFVAASTPAKSSQSSFSKPAKKMSEHEQIEARYRELAIEARQKLAKTYPNGISVTKDDLDLLR